MKWPFVLTAIAAALLGGGCGSPEPLEVKQTLSLEAIPFQWGSGGTHKTTIKISNDQWANVAAHFEPAAVTAKDERRQIAIAVGHMERIAGSQTPTHRDLGRNEVNPAGIGRLDCIDESTNTTTYLALFHQRDLLRHHDLMTRSFRAPYVFDSHFGAVIRERTTGSLFVVDSWFRDNGHPAVIQRYERWMKKDDPPDVVE